MHAIISLGIQFLKINTGTHSLMNLHTFVEGLVIKNT